MELQDFLYKHDRWTESKRGCWSTSKRILGKSQRREKQIRRWTEETTIPKKRYWVANCRIRGAKRNCTCEEAIRCYSEQNWWADRWKKALGLFKVKEKKVIQGKIDEVETEATAARKLLDSQQSEIEKTIVPLRGQLSDIVDKLSEITLEFERDR